MAQDIYKIAAQGRLRFPSQRGDLTVEHLFQLPLKSTAGYDLDSTARAIHNDLKGLFEESFVADPADNPRKAELEIKLAIVKDVILTIQTANAAALARQDKAEKRKKILDAMAAKQEAALTEGSMEELNAKLAALDA